ncbi:transcription and mRNA export factor ENY2-like isoform X1 [Arapaima gigas]
MEDYVLNWPVEILFLTSSVENTEISTACQRFCVPTRDAYVVTIVRLACRNASERVDMSKESQLRAVVNQKLIEMGERERLKELLRARLIECGWKDQLKAHCKDVIREKDSEHVTVEDLVAEITPKGRALVPDSVKKELLQRIRAFLAQHATL